MSLTEPTLPEAMLIEELAVAAVTVVAAFVPGGGTVEAVISVAVDEFRKDAPAIEQALATLLGVATRLYGPENLRKLLDAETIKLANVGADMAEELKFGPAK